jgi:hypothetical protein
VASLAQMCHSEMYATNRWGKYMNELNYFLLINFFHIKCLVTKMAYNLISVHSVLQFGKDSFLIFLGLWSFSKFIGRRWNFGNHHQIIFDLIYFCHKALFGDKIFRVLGYCKIYSNFQQIFSVQFAFQGSDQDDGTLLKT